MGHAGSLHGWRRSARRAGRSLRLGSLRGIPIRIDPTWIFIFVLVAWSAAAYFPRALPGHVAPLAALGLGALASLALFASILAHELSHSLVAQALGYEVRSITLFVFGGVSEIHDEPRTGRDELAISIVGPVTSLGIAGVLEATDRLVALPPIAGALLHYLAAANLAITIFNLVPGFPLDGGRLLRAFFRMGDRSLVDATRRAAAVGKAIGLALIVLGLASFVLGGGLGGAWIALIGWFLRSAADASYRQVALRHRLGALRVGDVAQRLVPLEASDTVGAALLGRGLLAGGPAAYPVVREGHLLGLVPAAALRSIPRESWEVVPVGELVRDPARPFAAGSPLLAAVEQMGEAGATVAPVVDERGSYEGLLRIEDVARLAEESGTEEEGDEE